jgi:hypothetical protein
MQRRDLWKMFQRAQPSAGQCPNHIADRDLVIERSRHVDKVQTDKISDRCRNSGRHASMPPQFDV